MSGDLTDEDREALWPLMTSVDMLAKKHGSLRAAARVLGVDAGYLSRLRSGQKSDPSDKLLRRLGIHREVRFFWGKQ